MPGRYRPLYGAFAVSAAWSAYWLWDHRWKALVIMAMVNVTLVWGYEQGRLAQKQPDDNAQPERDPHRDGCVHDPAWACEDCLAARSAAPQPADNAHTDGAS